ncbi:glycoside hydrolase [Penicillium lagena]|uniref:glycoside hydrolase n=1 Tax=Penicillium lagena TaxID=94218 RepID=UPI0025423B7D|nr:glycoside hydrolase [Penicillium lagena]KAJ5626041.1 glycoside hydrolase [Penicillium lagena]
MARSTFSLLFVSFLAQLSATSATDAAKASPVTERAGTPTDYSSEAWSSLWYQVGPVSPPPFTTTVVPTPEPSHPAPPFYLNTGSTFTQGNLSTYQLPKDFVWGVASASYQVEGAVMNEGRGPTIWDLLTHRVPGWVSDGTTGDITDLFYYMYPQDIARMQSFGIPYFYLTIAWSRIFPFGKGYINEEGLKHYDDVLQKLVDAGIKPIVALYHWDTPLALMNEYNGWVSEDIVDDFLAYAKVVMARWDKYVPIWITINEPQVYCGDGQGYAGYPEGYWPQYNITGERAVYYCGHYSLLAHATVVDWYKNDFKGQGRVTFKNSGSMLLPNTTSTEDAAAVKRGFDFDLGWFNDPVWTTGDYPASMRETLGDMLPMFTHEQSRMLLGSCDFFAIDGYSTSFAGAVPNGVAACQANSSDPNWPLCVLESQTTADGWDIGFTAGNAANAGWLKSVPQGVRMLLNWIQDTYTGPKGKDIVLTEFGFAEPFEDDLTEEPDRRYDQLRLDYFVSYLNALLQAKVEDGVNVTGSIAWGIYDNFEWQNGLSTQFGLQNVNYTTLERYPEASLFAFTDFFKQHGL